MAYENAKFSLARARTALERTEAIRAAIFQGMPVNEIEEYLDWLDTVRPLPPESKGDVSEDRDQNRCRGERGQPAQDVDTKGSSRFHIVHSPQWWHTLAAKAASFLAAAGRKRKPGKPTSLSEPKSSQDTGPKSGNS
jgi:hypothetical protein